MKKKVAICIIAFCMLSAHAMEKQRAEKIENKNIPNRPISPQEEKIKKKRTVSATEYLVYGMLRSDSEENVDSQR
jgi:hypothetical protein